MGIQLTACSKNENRVKSVENVLSDSLFMLVGSYASANEEGIKLFAFDQEKGVARYVNGLTGVDNPSYLTPRSDGKRVYAVSENDAFSSKATALSMDLTTGELAILNSKFTQGAAPCHIAISPQEDFVLTANYNGGNISIFGCDSNGELMEPRVISFIGHGHDPIRQDKPYLHNIGFTPDGIYTFAVDLGSDCIHVFPINQQNKRVTAPFLDEDKPASFALPSGCGPRHVCFSPDHKTAYLITELSGEVFVFSYEGKQTKIIQTIKADTLGARGSADIHPSPDGRYVYASNRLKGDGIAIFKVNPEDGTLKKVGYQLTGIHPRNFVISPNGKYLLVACRFSNEIQIYRRDETTGLLKYTGKSIHTKEPTCLKFVERNL